MNFHTQGGFMKTKMVLTGILSIIVLVFGVTLVGCDNGTTNDGGGGSNPLEGTWSYFYQGQIEESITFSGSTYDWKETTSGGLVTYERGSYSISGNTITFHPTKRLDTDSNLVDVSGENAYPYVYVYSIVGNNLILDEYTYTK
jgi:hypothetical protein